MKEIKLKEFSNRIKTLSAKFENKEKLDYEIGKEVDTFIKRKIREEGFDDNKQPSQDEFDEICRKNNVKIKEIIEKSLIEKIRGVFK